MSGAVVTRAHALLATVDLSAIGTVVDIGGGKGQLLAAVLEAKPGLRDVLFDRPEVFSRAEIALADHGLRDRCTSVSGDFFVSVPDDGDAYVLAQVLHDWAGAEATVILRVCRRAMRSRARLWIVEQVIGSRDAFDRGKLIDLHMLVLFGAQERTAEEYCLLLEAAGFGEVVVHSTDTPYSVIEAVRP